MKKYTWVRITKGLLYQYKFTSLRISIQQFTKHNYLGNSCGQSRMLWSFSSRFCSQHAEASCGQHHKLVIISVTINGNHVFMLCYCIQLLSFPGNQLECRHLFRVILQNLPTKSLMVINAMYEHKVNAKNFKGEASWFYVICKSLTNNNLCNNLNVSTQVSC